MTMSVVNTKWKTVCRIFPSIISEKIMWLKLFITPFLKKQSSIFYTEIP